MIAYAVFFALLAGMLVLLYKKPSGVIYVKRLAVPVICLAFVLCLLFFSKTAVAAASRGLRLWFDIVFPSLFPFFVASELLNASGFAKAAGVLLEPVMRPVFNVPGCGSLALLMGVAGGYPAGAKITCDLRGKGAVTKTEAERLLAFTNNSGPLFITGAVATGMYGAPPLGFFLLACHILACLTVGVLFRFYRRGRAPRVKTPRARILARLRQELRRPQDANGADMAALFGEAVKNSIALILAIGGFIVLFSVIISLLLETGAIGSLASAAAAVLSPFGLGRETAAAVLSGFFEITTGSSLASGLRGVPLEQQLPAASFIIGWAGLSVHSQVLSITAKTDVSIRPYLLGKLLQAVIASVYTWCGLKLFNPDIGLPKPAMAQFPDFHPGWLETASASLAQLALAVAMLAVLILWSMARAYIRKKKLRQ